MNARPSPTSGTRLPARCHQIVAGLFLLAFCAYANAGQLKLSARPNGPVESYPGTSHYYEPIANGSDSRSALIFKPSGKLNGAAVILLHASGMNQSQMANLTKAGRLAAHGTLVVVPAAVDNRGGEWNDSISNESKTDDVGYMTALISTIIKEYKVDPDRVTMAGYSNGGFMTARMVCEKPELLHAAVLVAANMWQAEQGQCKDRPDSLKVILIQGTKDWVVPYEGKARIGLPPAEQAFAWFRTHRKGCLKANNNQLVTNKMALTNSVDDGTSVTRQDDGCGTEFYTVKGGGHTWPGGGEPATLMGRMLGKTSANLDATALLDSVSTD